jgi:hypothetical protein
MIGFDPPAQRNLISLGGHLKSLEMRERNAPVIEHIWGALCIDHNRPLCKIHRRIGGRFYGMVDLLPS